MVNRFVTYGDYADGYSEDWSPVGSPALFTASGGITFAPSRLPGYPTYVMSWEQASAKSAGADSIAYDPYMQELLIQLSWAGMSGADKASLEAFHKSGVNGMAGQFSYYNPTAGPALPVRFADAALGNMPEVGYDRYRVELTLRVDINYPQMNAPGVPAAITGNRFVIGGVAMPFPIPLRSNSGYEVTIPQTMERNSAGSPIIYNKSRLILKRHQMALVLDFDAFIRQQSFFFTFVHGQRNKFTWYDKDEVSRVVRLADSRITIRQLGYNRYTTAFNLVEEI